MLVICMLVNNFIRIPFSAMFSSGSPVSCRETQQPSRYKLINGFPSDTDLKIRKSYAMSFDTETKNAKWVYEILNKETIVNECERPEDFGQGYVKGHLAAAANHRWCREANNDANLFSNIIPQNSTLNNSTWKTLENEVVTNKICNVHVYTGPLYLKQMDNSVLGGKRVPTHLFKVIIVENVNGTVRAPACYVMPNEKIRHFLSDHASQLLVQALVLSRLDYCNVLLAGLPATSIKPLQLIQNTAAR
uniref:Uncharacterized protein n=1 Tax=Sinocyclocheilus grahami TaxID=75366 RepID=A0A672L885_SINGR